MDPANPVVALCAQGMAVEGTPDEARKLFERAWEALSAGMIPEATATALRPEEHLDPLPPGGYGDFISLGIRRLRARLP